MYVILDVCCWTHFSVALMALLAIKYCLADEIIFGDDMIDTITDGIMDRSIVVLAGLESLFCNKHQDFPSINITNGNPPISIN
jgi:hypothetical protein